MQRAAQALFAIGLGCLGVITLIYGDFALVWQPVPTWMPAHQAVAYGSGIVLLVCGIGLLVPVLTGWAAILCFAYCLLWVSLKVPPLFAKPLVVLALIKAELEAAVEQFGVVWGKMARDRILLPRLFVAAHPRE